MGRAQDEKVLSGNGAMIPNVRKARVVAGARRPRPDAKADVGETPDAKVINRPLACVRGRFIRKREYKYSSSPS